MEYEAIIQGPKTVFTIVKEEDIKDEEIKMLAKNGCLMIEQNGNTVYINEYMYKMLGLSYYNRTIE